MPFCTSCGTEVQSFAKFCSVCGGELGGPGQLDTTQRYSQERLGLLPYRVSSNRVLLLTVVSFGSYLFYWFYLTWKQHRDHTQTQAFPIWHALTLFVPIYGLFRTHAHMRSFKELMLNAGLYPTISAGGAVGVVLISSALDWTTFQLTGGFTTSVQEMSQGTAVVTAILSMISIALVAGLLVHVQSNLNGYWAAAANENLVNARIGIGEVVFSIIGILFWFDTLASLLSSSYRMG